LFTRSNVLSAYISPKFKSVNENWRKPVSTAI